MDDAREQWLSLGKEEPLDPDLRICDAHHHLWDHPADRYLLDELRSDALSGHRVEKTVFVECHSSYRTSGPEALRPVGETEAVVAMADASERLAKGGGPVVAGIVGFADLRLGAAVEDVLVAHLDAGSGRFRGIRYPTAWDPDPSIRPAYTNPPPGLLGDKKFRAGVVVLGRYRLTCDVWLYHPQIPELTSLARDHEDVSFVLDHLGGPLGIGPYAGQRVEVRAQWRAALRELATCPNVCLKLGGIGIRQYGFGWHKRPKPPTSQELAEAWGEEIRWCIEQFGAQRCMFESNFPIDRLSCSYAVLWNAFQRIVADASPEEKALLFHDTATSLYRLGASDRSQNV